MEHARRIVMAAFFAKYKRTDTPSRRAIFGSRKALMEELYTTGVPIYCDQSYYAPADAVELVEKMGDHFRCGIYDCFEDWRDCHYYSEYADADGNKVWLMTGGRYD